MVEGLGVGVGPSLNQTLHEQDREEESRGATSSVILPSVAFLAVARSITPLSLLRRGAAVHNVQQHSPKGRSLAVDIAKKKKKKVYVLTSV